MNYLLLLASVAAASLNSVLLHKLDEDRDAFEFNMYTSFIWMIILFACNGFKITFTKQAVLFALLYGTIQVMFQVSKAKAMSAGPVSITTLIGNCSLLLSTAVGVIVWREKVTVFQVLGLIMLLAAVIYCSYSKQNTAHTAKWKFYCVVFFVFAASVGIVFKTFSKSGSNDCTGNMMFFAAVVMSLMLLCITLFNKRKSTAVKNKFDRKYLMLVLSCGILSCLYNRLNIYLTGQLPSIVFFPSFNGGVVLASFLMSKFILKEKLRIKQTIAILIGALAICIVGVM